MRSVPIHVPFIGTHWDGDYNTTLSYLINNNFIDNVWKLQMLKVKENANDNK